MGMRRILHPDGNLERLLAWSSANHIGNFHNNSVRPRYPAKACSRLFYDSHFVATLLCALPSKSSLLVLEDTEVRVAVVVNISAEHSAAVVIVDDVSAIFYELYTYNPALAFTGSLPLVPS